MPEISKVQLPSGGVYDIKDATARQMISGGVSFIIAWDGASTPVPGNIPAGVVVEYEGTSYTGTMAAADAQAGAFYLIKDSDEVSNTYNEYVPIGPDGNKTWEKIGSTDVDLSNYVTNVVLNKQTDVALGEATTFSLTSGSVTFGTPSTDTFVKSVTAETGKNLVTTSITPAGTATSVINSVTDNTSKLVTTTVPNVTGNTDVTIPNVTGNTSVSIPNVTSAGSPSTWTFTMGSGDASETLIISGANSVAPTLGANLTATNTTLGTDLTASRVTLGTAKTVATGALSTSGAGGSVVTSTSTDSTNVATVGAAVTVATGATSTTGTGDAVVTGVTVGTSGTAVTSMPTASVSTGITVGTNDKITTLTNATSLDVTKGGE